MAKILTPLLRKLPSLSSTKHLFRCKCESIVESYTNGRCFEKESKPARISYAEKDCSVEKDCSCISVRNTSASSSTLANNCEPILDDRDSEVPRTTSETAALLQCQCHQCQGTTSLVSVPQDKPTARNNPPEVPTNCCMTGCPNCVWLKFAEEMMQFSIEGGTGARKIIEGIEDLNMRTFLLLELDNMQKV